MRSIFFVALTALLSAPPVFGQVFTSTNLPLVVIQTAGNQTIPDEPKILASMKIIYRGPGLRNALTDTVYNYNGSIGIEIRGANSQSAPKKSYGLETLSAPDINASSQDVSLMGFPADNDWILYASAFDNSFLSNVMGYQFSRQMGRYASRSQYVEVFLNGTYQGLYVLGENVKRGSNRVPVSKMEPADISGDKLTGGYIVKIDNYDGNYRWPGAFSPECRSGFQHNLEVHYPKVGDLQSAQSTYIRQYITNFENQLHALNFDPATGYQQYANLTSFADYFLMNEVTKNSDAYSKSTYMYKDRDSKGGKLTMGPMWDLDLGYGAGFCLGGDSRGWTFENNMPCTPNDQIVPFWWSYLMRDTTFVQTTQRRWAVMRQFVFSTAHVTAVVDSLTAIFQEAHARNAVRWGMSSDLTSAVNAKKNFLTGRLAWMDANMSGLGYYIRPYSISEYCTVNPPTLHANNSWPNNLYTWKKNGSNANFSQDYAVPQADTYSVTFSYALFDKTCEYTFSSRTITQRTNQVITSRRSGEWEDENTWSCGKPPIPAQQAYLSPGHVVRLNGNSSVAKVDFGTAAQLVFRSAAQLNLP